MDKTNINALVQSIERSKNGNGTLWLLAFFTFNITIPIPPKNGLNLFKESRRTSPLGNLRWRRFRGDGNFNRT